MQMSQDKSKFRLILDRLINPPTTILPFEWFDESEEIDSENKGNVSDDWFDDIEDYINMLFTEIKDCDPKTDNVIRSIHQLGELVSSLQKNYPEKLNVLGYYCIKLNFVELLGDWMKMSRKEDAGNRLVKNIFECLSLLGNLCDVSVTVCEYVVKLKFHAILIKELSKLALKIDKETQAVVPEDVVLLLERKVKYLFVVLYNVMRIYPPSRIQFREDGIVDVCLRYLPIGNLLIKSFALISLSFAADLDKSSEIIEATEQNLLFLLRQLKECLHNVEHEYLGFSAEELMICFSQLAKNRSNAIEMSRIRILHICMKVLQAQFNDAEIKWTLQLVWSLCFVDEIKNKILDCKMLEKVSSYVDSRNKDIAEAARGIVWELGQKAKESESAHVADDIEERNSEVDQHIMISYCWKQQELAKKIFNRLKQYGKKVWLDIDGKMAGDSLEKMAEAVESPLL